MGIGQTAGASHRYGGAADMSAGMWMAWYRSDADDVVAQNAVLYLLFLFSSLLYHYILYRVYIIALNCHRGRLQFCGICVIYVMKNARDPVTGASRTADSIYVLPHVAS
ncbi:MAG: hypothetical protein GX358_09840 [candidate division WS1 bacterium]|nr:hypothetical protein [candidate division WS1 bacterium]